MAHCGSIIVHTKYLRSRKVMLVIIHKNKADELMR